MLVAAISFWMASPTFHRDIAPLLFEKCAGCHQPEGMAPFPLIDYRDVASRAPSILGAVESGFMPPWLPEPGYGDFEGERRLSNGERSLLREWIESGAPEGDASERIRPPPRSHGWQLGTPDLVVEMPRSYRLAADGEDVYRNFVVPLPLESRAYVRAIELRPGTVHVVHHARILVDRSGRSRALDERDSEPGYDGMLADAAEFPDGLFLGWSPGKVPAQGEEALVFSIEPTTDLVLQMHMMPTGKPEDIRASVGLYFTDEPPRRRAAVLQLGSRTIDIAPGVRSHVVEDTYLLPADVEAIGIYPHAHFLCREMQAFATLPDGSRRWLLWIKNWDFYWQDEYRYASPVPLPRGTSITMRYTYDNSASDRRVRWGPRSKDEMGDLLLMIVPENPDDLPALTEDFRRHELRQEVEGYLKILESEPNNADVRHELAFAYLELGRTANAIREWQTVVRARPAFAEAHYNLGGALAREGHRGESISSFERAIEANESYAEAHHNLGVLLQSEGELEEAEARYRRAIELRPEYALAHHHLGSVLLARGNTKDAIAHLEKAVAIDPGDAQAHYALGTALGRDGKLEDEIAHYRRALEVKPDYPEVLNNLGSALTALNRPAEAIPVLERAVLLRPNYALAHSNLAAAYASAERFAEAIRVAEEALALALEEGRTELADEIRKRLELYRSRAQGPKLP
jgi:tetratricopeptide (TPR) repeat protein